MIDCCLCWCGDLVQERHGDLTPGLSGHQLAGTNVVDSKWRLLTGSTVLYSLGLQCHFRLLTSWARRYWLSGEEGGPTFLYSATSSDRQALTIHNSLCVNRIMCNETARQTEAQPACFKTGEGAKGKHCKEH